MICNNCGKSVADGARFCDGCGAAMFAAQPVQQQPVQQPVYQQPVYQQPVYQQPAYDQQGYPPLQQPVSPIRPPVHYSVAPAVLDVDSPSLSALKKLIRSPLVIFTVLLMIAQVVVEALLTMDVINTANAVLQYMGFTDVELTMTGSSINIAVIISILAFCICIGCSFAKKGFCTAGLMIFKVMSIISLVIASLAAMAVLAVEALLYADANALLTAIMESLPEGMELVIINPEEFETACLIAIGVTVAIFGLVILYLARVLGMLNAATQIARTGRTKKKASVYVAIICIIGGIFALMMAAVQAVYLSSVPGIAELELPILKIVAPTLVSGVTSLLIGSLIFTYRSTVQPLADEVPVAQPEMAVVPPVIEEPVIEEPVIQEPVVEEPVIEEPVIEEPVIEEPVIEEPVIEEPVVEEPVVVVPQAEFAFCGYCGKKVLTTAKFCPYCGKAR